MSEDYGDWSHRQRVNQERWDYATNSGQYAPKQEKSYDWSSSSAPIYSGGGGGYSGGWSGSGSGGIGCLSALTLFPAIAAWPLLYPMPVGIAFLAAGFGYGILESISGAYTAHGRMGLTVGSFLIGLIVLVPLSRLDHRLARSKLWRVPRHLIRLALITLAAYQLAALRLAPASAHLEGILAGLPLLRNPIYLVVLLAVPLIAHIVLTRRGLRDWWHECLERVKLRGRDA
jgi:hypothetical protein